MSLVEHQFRRLRSGGAAAAAAVIASASLLLPVAAAFAEDPPDYVGRLQKQQEESCIITGVCDQLNRPVAPGAPAMVTVHFAATAISPTTLGSGSSHGRNSRDEAEDVALHNCATRAADCKLLIWGSNRCIALAVSPTDRAYGYDAAASRAAAAANAMTRCEKAGGKSCVVQATPCASDDIRWPSPLPLPPAPAGAASIDPTIVGTWEIAINPGRWVMEISAKGTFEFHSEAMDNAPSRAGTFTASNGNWTLNATDGWSDGGSYSVTSPAEWVATGKLGTGTWHRVAN